MTTFAAARASHDLLTGTAGWIALAVYVTGFIVTARIFFATADVTDNRGEERFAAFGVGLFWPVALILIILCGVVMLPTLGVKTKQDRHLEAQSAEWERQKAAARTAELEAENERLRKAMGEL